MLQGKKKRGRTKKPKVADEVVDDSRQVSEKEDDSDEVMACINLLVHMYCNKYVW